MDKKWTPHVIAVTAFVVFVVLGLACASEPPYAGPDAEVTYSEVNVEELRLRTDPEYYYAGKGFKLINSHVEQDRYDGKVSISTGFYGDDYVLFDRKTVNQIFPMFEIRAKNMPYRTVVYLSVHPKDPAKPKKDLYFRLDKIEGLMSLEEAQAIVAAEEKAKAEQAAAAEARRKALENANRYDPSKFTVVPSDFKPADYTSADLFKAASAARNLQISSNELDAITKQLQSAFMFGMGGEYILQYVSDVTFVRQNGTDIEFTSDDKAISQKMNIDQRSGLQPGQKVRVYYTIMRSPLTTWDIVAIERR